MKKVDEDKLKAALKRLEESSDKIVQTRGYTSETDRVRALTELIKEQIKNENLGNTTSSSR